MRKCHFSIVLMNENANTRIDITTLEISPIRMAFGKISVNELTGEGESVADFSHGLMQAAC